MRQWEQVTGALASCLGRQASWFLRRGEGRGVVGGLSASEAVLCAGMVSRTLPLLQASQKWQLVLTFWYPVVYSLPHMLKYTVIFSTS